MTTKNRTGSKHAAANALGSLDDRLRQLQSLVPGADGGGSVAAPFTIGGYTFGVGEQVDLGRLAEVARPGPRWIEDVPTTIAQGASTDIAYSALYSDVKYDVEEVAWNFWFTVEGPGTAGDPATLRLPVLALRSTNAIIGQAQIYDASGADRYSLEVQTQVGILAAFSGESTAGDLWGSTPSIALAVGDFIMGQLRYRPRLTT